MSTNRCSFRYRKVDKLFRTANMGIIFESAKIKAEFFAPLLYINTYSLKVAKP